MAPQAVLIVSEEALKRYNLTPRARIAHMSVRADDPCMDANGANSRHSARD
jgi:acetyl-CoA acetyltransferase